MPRISRDRLALYILTRPALPSHTLVRVGEFGHVAVFWEGKRVIGQNPSDPDL